MYLTLWKIEYLPHSEQMVIYKPPMFNRNCVKGSTGRSGKIERANTCVTWYSNTQSELTKFYALSLGLYWTR